MAVSPIMYTVQLLVKDATLTSTPATVVISTLNSPPVANAGLPQTVAVGTTVHLDGSQSHYVHRAAACQGRDAYEHARDRRDQHSQLAPGGQCWPPADRCGRHHSAPRWQSVPLCTPCSCLSRTRRLRARPRPS